MVSDIENSGYYGKAWVCFRNNLKVRDFSVLLVFRIEEDGEVNVERMWVVVKEATAEGYVSILDNDPYFTDQIQAGVELEFAPKHIIDIYDDD